MRNEEKPYLLERHITNFWGRVPDCGGVDCWLWQGYVGLDGYGQIKCKGGAGGVTRLAHRVSYYIRYGALPPEGMYLDHLCRNRSCVNPAHLEPVTPRENVLRGEGPTAIAARKTACPKGHPYDENNTSYSKKIIRRQCRACARIRATEKRDRLNPDRLRRKTKPHLYHVLEERKRLGIGESFRVERRRLPLLGGGEN